MRTYAVVAVLAVAFLTACGEEERPPQREPLVEVMLDAPPDTDVTRDERITISGTVKPERATVEVLGSEVEVQDGRWSTEVALEPGANLIDVAGSANGRRPDFAALRVVREQRVPLPDLAGRDADTAQEELEGLGLEVRTRDGGGFFDPLLPGDPAVCSMDPGPGTQVLPGSEVTLEVARDC
jgi:beta-lactam-binding protein with PASTA domain